MKLRFKQLLILKVSLLMLIGFISCDNNETNEKKNAENLKIPLGVSIIADGINSENEWIDAQKIQIKISESSKIDVMLKHDNENILILFNLYSSGLFPEILFDVNNDKTTEWNSDDWWFHISASDCSSKGKRNDYSNCEVEQPDWTAVPNYPAYVQGNVDKIEVIIPFSKLGINLSSQFGMAVLVTNLNNTRKYWPPDSNAGNPSSWCNASFGYTDK